MTDLDKNLRNLHADGRDGWAAPLVNFAGAGFCLNLGARPRTSWDFNAKLHDCGYYAMDLSFSLSAPSDPLERSRLEKADYIFHILSDKCELNFPEGFYDKVSELIFLGQNRDNFKTGDAFVNVIDHPSLTLENGHFMIPFDQIPIAEQKDIEKRATEQAEEIVQEGNLELMATEYGIDTSKKWRYSPKKKMRVKETIFYRNQRFVREIRDELVYNTPASIDDQNWKEWAAKQFEEAWDEALSIGAATGN